MIPEVDPELLRRFEAGLDPARPEAGDIPARVLGYGEISCIFALEEAPGLALKRLPPFPDDASWQAFRVAVERYVGELERLDIRTLPFRWCEAARDPGRIIVYMVSPILPAERFGNRMLAGVPADRDALAELLDPIVGAYVRIARHNREHPELRIGFDGQISNWCFDRPGEDPVYIDLATPLLRVEGRELLDPELFLQAVPSLLRPLVRRLFLAEVLDRYYDLRLVLVDLLANFHKEGEAAKIAPALAAIERSLAAAKMEYLPIAPAEIDRYYREDARIWTIFLALRRLDRWWTTRLLRRRYEFILPGRIER